jgi:TolA-binding protein
MLNGDSNLARHEKFRELCALLDTGTLTPLEVSELQRHLDRCEECLEILREYRALTCGGMAALTASYAEQHELANWDERPARLRLLDRVCAEQQTPVQRRIPITATVQTSPLRRVAASRIVRGAFAACVIFAAGYASYCVGSRKRTPNSPSTQPTVVADRLEKVSQDKNAAEELLEAQAKRLAELEKESSQKQQELEKLRSALRSLEDRAKELCVANSQSEQRLQALSREREALNTQVQSTTQALEKERAELASARTERDKTVLRAASLEARSNELTATNREQERRLKDVEQYLSSDRDIRELMGARKLYIADVFDVDGRSRTQKPFGRVFYTQGKSLIFYAFDLEQQPKIVNANTFQVWGQREAPQGEQALPMNLGILYMDSEANRRWVMRFDDPKQLTEIDAVFVTVEPHGGSPKPTSKPFLYALLRNEANHP